MGGMSLVFLTMAADVDEPSRSTPACWEDLESSPAMIFAAARLRRHGR